MPPKKYCSITNYLESEHKDVFDLLKRLCMLKSLSPRYRKGDVSGITFLIPGKKLLGEIKAGIEDDDTQDDAIMTLKDLIIKGFCSDKATVGTFKNFNDRYIDVKKTDIKSDNDFKTLKSRDGNQNPIAVFHINEKPVVTTTAGKKSSRPSRATRGGAFCQDFLESRSAFFEYIIHRYRKDITETFNPPSSNPEDVSGGEANQTHNFVTNPAVEAILSLVDYLEVKNSYSECCKRIKSLISNDALTSLAIILRPYAGDQEYHLKTDVYKEWIQASHKPISKLFYACENMDTKYKNLSRGNHFSDLFNDVRDIMKSGRENQELYNCFSGIKQSMSKICNLENVLKRTNTNFNLAEMELRCAVSVVMQDTSSKYVFDDLCFMYKSYSLDTPLTVERFKASETDRINKAFFYSAYLFAAYSDALFYIPGIVDDNSPKLDALVNLSDEIHDHAPVLLWSEQMTELYNSAANVFNKK